MRGSARFMEDCHARFGDVFTLDLIAQLAAGPGARRDEGRYVFLADPQLVKQVFTADPNVVRAGQTNMFLLPVVGRRSILVLDEPDHMVQRKLLLPPFHGETVRGYGELMSGVAHAEIDRWPTDTTFSLWPKMQAITLEVVLRVVFGIDESELLARMRQLLSTMLNRMTSTRFLTVAALLSLVNDPRAPRNIDAPHRLLAPVDREVLAEISSRRSAPDLADRDDVLSTLIRARHEDGSPMNDRELRDELVTLLIAGHESTATMLAWIFELLLRHPGKLDRARQEARAGGDEYAAAVVMEALRLRPVLPFVLRRLSEPMQIGGYALPAGTWLAPCGYLVHRRQDLYPEPQAFLPERFLGRRPDPFAWLPFGGGVRRCIGFNFAQLEMTRVLQAVLTRAELRPASPVAEGIGRRFITLAPAHGARVVLTRRLSP
ncbi:MAG TPA: cytochrome P450 [Mycobacterium sp.]|nr:cytochrome P450 [Mycobacterium sp.]